MIDNGSKLFSSQETAGQLNVAVQPLVESVPVHSAIEIDSEKFDSKLTSKEFVDECNKRMLDRRLKQLTKPGSSAEDIARADNLREFFAELRAKEKDEEEKKQRYDEFYRSLNPLDKWAAETKIFPIRSNIEPNPSLFRIAENWAEFYGPFLASNDWLRNLFFERGEDFARRKYNNLSGIRKAFVCFGYEVRYRGAAEKPDFGGHLIHIRWAVKQHLHSLSEFPVGPVYSYHEVDAEVTE